MNMARDACGLQLFIEEFAYAVVFVDGARIVAFAREPARLPVAANRETKTLRIYFLTHIVPF